MRIPHLYNGKDRTFFYAAWEGERFSQGQEIISSIPTDLNRQGDFSQTVINYNNGSPVYANIYDPFYGAYTSNPSRVHRTFSGSTGEFRAVLGSPAISGQQNSGELRDRRIRAERALPEIPDAMAGAEP